VIPDAVKLDTLRPSTDLEREAEPLLPREFSMGLQDPTTERKESASREAVAGNIS
jgi:hypothetical protein